MNCHCATEWWVSENARTTGSLTHYIFIQPVYSFRSQYVGVGAVYRQKHNPNAVGSASPLTSCLQLNMHRPTVPTSQGRQTAFVLVRAACQLGFLKCCLEYFWIMKVIFPPSHTRGFSYRLEYQLLNPWKPSPHNTAFCKEYCIRKFFFWDEIHSFKVIADFLKLEGLWRIQDNLNLRCLRPL